jgi:hypothetical protein
MNREDIIRIAQDAGLHIATDVNWMPIVGLEYAERFAALIASAEREACIVDIQMHIPRSGRHTPEYQMAMRMIERIRARGQA